MHRTQYVYMLNNVIAAVSDGSKEEARAVLRHLMKKILDDGNQDGNHYYFKRLVDDLMMNWYDTYKRDGQGVYMPREVAGLPRKRPG